MCDVLSKSDTPHQTREFRARVRSPRFYVDNLCDRDVYKKMSNLGILRSRSILSLGTQVEDSFEVLFRRFRTGVGSESLLMGGLTLRFAG